MTGLNKLLACFRKRRSSLNPKYSSLKTIEVAVAEKLVNKSSVPKSGTESGPGGRPLVLR